MTRIRFEARVKPEWSRKEHRVRRYTITVPKALVKSFGLHNKTVTIIIVVKENP